MLVVFRPIFVADTKVIYGYHFIAPLTPFSTSSKLYELKLKWLNSFLILLRGLILLSIWFFFIISFT